MYFVQKFAILSHSFNQKKKQLHVIASTLNTTTKGALLLNMIFLSAFVLRIQTVNALLYKTKITSKHIFYSIIIP